AERKAYASDRGLRGKVIDTDVGRDLAIIQLIDPLPKGVQELKLAAASAAPSDVVQSVGNPGASDALWVHTSGSVRQVYRKQWLTASANGLVVRNCRVLESQSPVNPGDSGGPIVNERGELVAVVSSGKTTDGQKRLVQLMTFHIDVREVKAFLDE